MKAAYFSVWFSRTFKENFGEKRGKLAGIRIKSKTCCTKTMCLVI